MTYGKYATDHKEQVNIDRMKRERVAKARAEINKDGLGAMILYDYANVRYCTGHHVPAWGRGRGLWFAIQPRNGLPTLFVAGSHAKKVRDEWATWLEGRVKPAIPVGFLKLAGTNTADYFNLIKSTLAEYGVENEPIGIDTPLGLDDEFKKAGIKLVPSKMTMVRARSIKTKDEIECFRLACSSVEVAFDAIQNAIRPGVREIDLMAVASAAQWGQGCDGVAEQVICSGPNTNPNSRGCTDRAVRPGEIVYVDIVGPAYLGYVTCYYRNFCCGQPNQRQKEMYQENYEMLYKAINMIKPGASTSDIAAVWPTYDYWYKNHEVEEPFDNQYEAWECACAHALGLSVHDEIPRINRALMDNPVKLQEGMVLALETWTGRLNPDEGARIEEMVVVTKDGCEILSKYPVKEISAAWR